MTSARRPHYSYQDYLRALEVSTLKLEYGDGTIYAMPGGTRVHAELAARIIRLLGNALEGQCRVFSSDLKIRIEATDLSTFPDASVVCGNPAASEIDDHAVVNPTMVIEVTSRSTEDYDRGEKLSNYKQLDSLSAVLFISLRRAQVTVVERGEGGFRERELRAGERIILRTPALEIDVDAIYRGIALKTE